MQIKVRYLDSRSDYVNREQLSRLIENRQIYSFYRSSGWAILGVHPLRESRVMPIYFQEERRGKSLFS